MNFLHYEFDLTDDDSVEVKLKTLKSPIGAASREVRNDPAMEMVAMPRLSVFTIVAVVGFLAGLTVGLLWWQARRSLKGVASDIRRRMPPAGDQESAVEADPPQ